jgi:hypothetical protein
MPSYVLTCLKNPNKQTNKTKPRNWSNDLKQTLKTTDTYLSGCIFRLEKKLEQKHLISGNTNLCPYGLHQQAARDKGTLAQYGHSCYELVPNSKVSWQHASDICSSRRGHLVNIISSQEQNFIQGFMMSHFPDHAVWIGLTDRHTEGRFHWESGWFFFIISLLFIICHLVCKERSDFMWHCYFT